MLTFAITSFFILAGLAALAVIFWMFTSNYHKIRQVILDGLKDETTRAITTHTPVVQRPIRTRLRVQSNPVRRPARLAAAA